MPACGSNSKSPETGEMVCSEVNLMKLACIRRLHPRQHERVTQSDRALQETLRGFQRNAAAPVVSHFIAEKI